MYVHTKMLVLTWLLIPMAMTISVTETSSGGTLNVLQRRRGYHGKQAEFGEPLVDWLTNVKNRLFGRTSNKQQSSSPLPSPSPDITKITTELENEPFFGRQQQQQQVQQNPDGFLLDLTRLTFDPKVDWGLHIGNWYFIKKVSNNNEGREECSSSSWPTGYTELSQQEEATTQTTNVTYSTSGDNESPIEAIPEQSAEVLVPFE